MDIASDLVIGIDGGGTSCRVAIANSSGVILGQATAGAANFTTDPDASCRNVMDALRTAADKAGLPLGHVLCAPAHAGLAGIVTPQDALDCAQMLPLAHCSVTDDQHIAVVGALGDRNGALVAVGTGSFVAIRQADAVRSLGGWGLVLGDQASGAWLGRAALQHCALVADGLAESSDLATTLLARFCADRGEMIAFARDATPADFAAFAPMLFKAAEAGDAAARGLVTEGVQYIHLCLSAAGLGADDVVTLAGGLGPLYAPWLDVSVRDRLAPPEGTALDGALALARQMAFRP